MSVRLQKNGAVPDRLHETAQMHEFLLSKLSRVSARGAVDGRRPVSVTAPDQFDAYTLA